MRTPPILHHSMIFSHSILLTLLLLSSCCIKSCESVKIGVIGGGISGTFVSKYLVDLIDDCNELEELTLFDPIELGKIATKNDISDPSWQGSRVGTYQLEDGRIVELGASILTDQFRFILEHGG